MKLPKIQLLIPGIFVMAQICVAQTNTINIGEKCTIYSDILGEEKEYWIYKPLGYENNSKKYPVLYITDGIEFFSMASGTSEFMSMQFLIPEFIVVNIFHKDRNHELTPTHSDTNLDGFESDGAKVSGGGDSLLLFIENELIKEVENNYRTAPYRILAGHSLGGLFTIYVYLSRSELFDAFISMDPALHWDNHSCLNMLKSMDHNSPVFENKLYMSSAHNAPKNKPDESPMRRSHNLFYDEISERQNANVKLEYFKDENHLTVPYRSLYSGLSYIFTPFYIFDNPEYKHTVLFLKEHYQNISEVYGLDITPPERLVEMIGKHFLYDENNYKKAYNYFKFNSTNHPNSSKAFEFWARACIALENGEEAIDHLEKSTKLNPENKSACELLENLKNE